MHRARCTRYMQMSAWSARSLTSTRTLEAQPCQLLLLYISSFSRASSWFRISVKHRRNFQRLVGDEVDFSESLSVFGKEALVMDHDREIPACGFKLLTISDLGLLCRKLTGVTVWSKESTGFRWGRLCAVLVSFDKVDF